MNDFFNLLTLTLLQYLLRVRITSLRNAHHLQLGQYLRNAHLSALQFSPQCTSSFAMAWSQQMKASHSAHLRHVLITPVFHLGRFTGGCGSVWLWFGRFTGGAKSNEAPSVVGSRHAPVDPSEAVSSEHPLLCCDGLHAQQYLFP